MSETIRHLSKGHGIAAPAGPAPPDRNTGCNRIGGAGGFSLIELLVIIIISTILITVALPFSRNFITNYRMSSAASEIVADLHLAKISAVRRNLGAVAVFSSAAYTPDGRAGTYYVFIDSDGDWVNDAGEDMLVAPKTMPSGTTLYLSQFTANGTGTTDRAGFSPSGLVARSTTGAFVSGEVRLWNTVGRRVRIQVSPAGGIVMTKSQDGITWN